MEEMIRSIILFEPLTVSFKNSYKNSNKNELSTHKSINLKSTLPYQAKLKVILCLFYNFRLARQKIRFALRRGVKNHDFLKNILSTNIPKYSMSHNYEFLSLVSSKWKPELNKKRNDYTDVFEHRIRLGCLTYKKSDLWQSWKWIRARVMNAY